jgi:hypothetical protein
MYCQLKQHDSRADSQLNDGHIATTNNMTQTAMQAKIQNSQCLFGTELSAKQIWEYSLSQMNEKQRQQLLCYKHTMKTASNNWQPSQGTLISAKPNWPYSWELTEW